MIPYVSKIAKFFFPHKEEEEELAPFIEEEKPTVVKKRKEWLINATRHDVVVRSTQGPMRIKPHAGGFPLKWHLMAEENDIPEIRGVRVTHTGRWWLSLPPSYDAEEGDVIIVTKEDGEMIEKTGGWPGAGQLPKGVSFVSVRGDEFLLRVPPFSAIIP